MAAAGVERGRYHPCAWPTYAGLHAPLLLRLPACLSTCLHALWQAPHSSPAAGLLTLMWGHLNRQLLHMHSTAAVHAFSLQCMRRSPARPALEPATHADVGVLEGQLVAPGCKEHGAADDVHQLAVQHAAHKHPRVAVELGLLLQLRQEGGAGRCWSGRCPAAEGSQGRSRQLKAIKPGVDYQALPACTCFRCWCRPPSLNTAATRTALAGMLQAEHSRYHMQCRRCRAAVPAPCRHAPH